MGNSVQRVSYGRRIDISHIAQRLPASGGPLYHTTPGDSRQAHQLTEEEQIKIVQRMGNIQRLPTAKYEAKGVKECDICMIDYQTGDTVRYLPCMHFYHIQCIDEWLMRSFTCPHCMEPIETAIDH